MGDVSPAMLGRTGRILRMFGRLLFVFCALMLMTGCVRQPHILSWEEYSRRSHTWPYVARIETPKGRLLYYGAAHTKDVKDPQISEIERMWSEFRPDKAFNEGGDAFSHSGTMLRFRVLIRLERPRSQISRRSFPQSR